MKDSIVIAAEKAIFTIRVRQLEAVLYSSAVDTAPLSAYKATARQYGEPSAFEPKYRSPTPNVVRGAVRGPPSTLGDGHRSREV